MPFARAFGGRKERKTRAALARGEKGLNLVVTLVMNLVIMMGSWGDGTPCPVRRGGGTIGLGIRGKGGEKKTLLCFGGGRGR